MIVNLDLLTDSISDSLMVTIIGAVEVTVSKKRPSDKLLASILIRVDELKEKSFYRLL